MNQECSLSGVFLSLTNNNYFKKASKDEMKLELIQDFVTLSKGSSLKDYFPLVMNTINYLELHQDKEYLESFKFIIDSSVSIYLKEPFSREPSCSEVLNQIICFTASPSLFPVLSLIKFTGFSVNEFYEGLKVFENKVLGKV